MADIYVRKFEGGQVKYEKLDVTSIRIGHPDSDENVWDIVPVRNGVAIRLVGRKGDRMAVVPEAGNHVHLVSIDDVHVQLGAPGVQL